MCFETENKRSRTAKSDIECWKILKYDNSPLYGGTKSDGSTHRITTPYIKGKKNRKVSLVVNNGYINKGYHSYIYRDDADYFKTNHFEKVCKFVIPAGTRYYENDTEYVSETIILID